MLTSCSSQSNPQVTPAETVAPLQLEDASATPTITEPTSEQTLAPLAIPTGPTKAQVKELSPDIVLHIEEGSNSAVYKGVTYSCDNDVNAPIFDGVQMKASIVQLFEENGELIAGCAYALTDEQLFG